MCVCVCVCACVCVDQFLVFSITMCFQVKHEDLTYCVYSKLILTIINYICEYIVISFTVYRSCVINIFRDNFWDYLFHLHM